MSEDTQAERCALLIEDYLSFAPKLDAENEQRISTALVVLVGAAQASRIIAQTQDRPVFASAE